MKSADIRESFLSFFESKGAKRLPSSSLVPDDPSLLLTSAGMVQFKPVFLGARDIGVTRATTCQKCARTTDIDIIGTTGRHHSFFEMLGNFSFGDYFKSEACAWAYEYSTEVLGMDPDRLWFSIYEDDDEAEAVWRDEVGVPQERIVRMGAKDNFWSAGPTGPCGPCSELYYDQGSEVGCGLDTCAPGCDCDRFVEYWNLVFMQYDRLEDGTLEPLPKKNIDTGMGLERVAAITQGVRTNFETDDLRALVAVGEGLSGVTLGAAEKTDVSLRILADHARAVAFLIADGVLPSNEGRGYVLRRLLRRAIRHGRLLGVDDAFMVQLIDTVIERWGAPYPELVDNAELIRGIVASEEERFSVTLRQGLVFLTEAIDRTRAEGATVLDGNEAFTLHDTYGFPYELTSEIAAESGLEVDHGAFEAAMKAQRERGRAAVKDESWSFGSAFDDIARTAGATGFLGYAADEAESTVVGIVAGGVSVERIEAGQEGEIVLAATPFYAEQGGQVGDTGTLSAGGVRFAVSDTRFAVPGLVSHVGTLEAGRIAVGDAVHAAIDVMRRERIRRNHTATHILHWALRRILGDHVRQSGSLVAPERLRFDFTHFEAVSAEQLHRIEEMVNHKIMENHQVLNYETSLATAREMGVTALFGEKYGEIVRVLEVGNFSKELCGGTHVAWSSEIGLLKIVSEGSVGANLRRIEAVTSFDALAYTGRIEAELDGAAAALRVGRFDVAERAGALVKRVKDLENAMQRAKGRMSGFDPASLTEGALDAGYPVVIAQVPDMTAAEMRGVWDVVRTRLGDSAAAVIASKDPESGAPLLLAAGAPGAVEAGFDAGSLIKTIAPRIKGGGGGRREMAQAGGKDASGIEAALAEARTALGAG
ncbi:MAG TPA: alanine--tRNA ligase [Coriobacteriia bacterium]|nr:MAG: Alanine--tRNA ligase [Actinobacteria bacterium 66_15]HAL30821.1 alanine--tRNA ligase [Coriobacteriia bacterium]